MSDKERKTQWEERDNIKIAIICNNDRKKITLSELIKKSEEISQEDIGKEPGE